MQLIALGKQRGPKSEVASAYPMPEFDGGGLPLFKHAEELEEVEAWLNRLGIRTQATRIQRYIRYLRQAGSETPRSPFTDPVGHPFRHAIDRSLYVLREIHELMWIYEGLNQREPPGTKEKLEKVVGGADFAAMDRRSVSRDTQFELRIAAYFVRAGYDVDLSTDTDVVAAKGNRTFYIECKRIGSRQQIATRLKGALAQLVLRMPKSGDGHRFFGVAALDVTKVAFPHNGVTWGMTVGHARDNVRQKLREIEASFEKLVWPKGQSQLLGALLQIHFPALAINPPQQFTVFTSTMVERQSRGLHSEFALRAFKSTLRKAAVPLRGSEAPKRVKPRTRVRFDPGDEYFWGDGYLEQLAATGAIPRREEDEVVVKLVKAGATFNFHQGEMELLVSTTRFGKPGGLLRPDVERFGHELLAALYLQRVRWWPNDEDAPGTS